ncbi:TAXI family TRAP transporter solute-binding subunit [Thermodesulfobacteriota bacterium]
MTILKKRRSEIEMERKGRLTILAGLCLILFLAAQGIMMICVQQIQAAPDHEEVILTLVTSRFGSQTYVTGYAVEKLFKRAKHPWLKVIAMEGIGGTDNALTYQKLPKEKRATRIINVGDAGYMAALRGSKPWFKKPIKFLRGVCSLGNGELFFASFDPNIKTIYDLAGKKLGGPNMGSSSSVRLLRFLEAAGIKDKVDVKWLGFRKAPEALGDRKVDAILVVSFGHEVVGGFKPLFAARKDKLYIAEIPPELFPKVYKAGWPLLSAKLKPGTLIPNQKTAITVHRMLVSWWTGMDTEPEVVYEFLKVIYDNIGMFTDYLSQATSPTRADMPTLPVLSEKEMHPGALKFYKEVGMKIGPQ